MAQLLRKTLRIAALTYNVIQPVTKIDFLYHHFEGNIDFKCFGNFYDAVSIMLRAIGNVYVTVERNVRLK